MKCMSKGEEKLSHIGKQKENYYLPLFLMDEINWPVTSCIGLYLQQVLLVICLAGTVLARSNVWAIGLLVVATVNFCFEGIEGESLLLLLDDKGIQASSGSACTSGSLDPSHVLLAIGRPHEVAHGSLRLSLSDDVTTEEVDYIIKSVKEVVTYLRDMSPFWRDLVNGKREHVFKK